MKLRTKGRLALSLALLELAITPILLRVNGISSSGTFALSNTLGFLFYVFMVGSIASLALCYYNDRFRGLRAIVASREMLVLVAIAGLFNDAISQFFLGFGSIGTNPSIGAIVFRTWTIMLAILTPLILRNRVTKAQLGAIIIGMFGLYLIVSNGTLITLQSSELPYLGILILSALAVTVSNLIMKKYNMDTLSAIAIFNVVSFVFLGLITIPLHYTYTLTLTSALSAVFLGVIAYAIGSYLCIYALKVLGTISFSNVILIVPFFTIVLSFLLIGTPLEWYYFVAAAMIGAGVLMQNRHTAIQYISSGEMRRSKIPVFDVTGAFTNTRSAAMQGFLRRNNKALAIKLRKSSASDKAVRSMSSKGCILFTTSAPPPDINSSQLDYIKDALNMNIEEIGVIGIGPEAQIEAAFNALLNGSAGARRFTKS